MINRNYTTQEQQQLSMLENDLASLEIDEYITRKKYELITKYKENKFEKPNIEELYERFESALTELISYLVNEKIKVVNSLSDNGNLPSEETQASIITYHSNLQYNIEAQLEIFKNALVTKKLDDILETTEIWLKLLEDTINEKNIKKMKLLRQDIEAIIPSKEKVVLSALEKTQNLSEIVKMGNIKKVKAKIKSVSKLTVKKSENRQAKTKLINKIDITGINSLHAACLYNHPTIVSLVLEKGADVNIKSMGAYSENTPLHYAVMNDNAQIIKLLVDNSAVSLPNQDGEVPVYTALKHSKSNAAQQLLRSNFLMFQIPLAEIIKLKEIRPSENKYDEAQSILKAYLEILFKLPARKT